MRTQIAITFTVICLTETALALDCGQGAIPITSFQRFHSEEFAGRLAIAPTARSPTQARRGRLFCLLQDATVVLPRRADGIYFVFNNMVVGLPEEAERAFIGVETRTTLSHPPQNLHMRKFGTWERAQEKIEALDTELRVSGEQAREVAGAHRQTIFARLFDFSRQGEAGGTITEVTEEQFAQRVGANVHGAVRPRPGRNLKRTWDMRHKFSFLGILFGSDDPVNESVTTTWISFDQRTSDPWYRRDWRTRVVWHQFIGDAEQVELRLFGSNGAIPDRTYVIRFD